DAGGGDDAGGPRSVAPSTRQRAMAASSGAGVVSAPCSSPITSSGSSLLSIEKQFGSTRGQHESPPGSLGVCPSWMLLLSRGLALLLPTKGAAMLVVMDKHATPANVEQVLAAVRQMGLTPHPMPGATRTAIGITGNIGAVDPRTLEVLPGVSELIRVTKPF